MTEKLTPEALLRNRQLHSFVRDHLREASKKGWTRLRNCGATHRQMILAWAFIRDFDFRRCENRNRVQTREGWPTVYHNRPDRYALASVLLGLLWDIVAEEVAREEGLAAQMFEPDGTTFSAEYADARTSLANELGEWLSEPMREKAAPKPKAPYPYVWRDGERKPAPAVAAE